jgi:hypothetical protein
MAMKHICTKNDLFWYDDFPHPNDKSLTTTYPHHKHMPPDIKHHRIPAGELSFLHTQFANIDRRNPESEIIFISTQVYRSPKAVSQNHAGIQT